MEQPLPLTDLPELGIDPETAGYLSETARWARFLSIIGFIGCGLMVLYGLFFGSIAATLFSGFGGGDAVMASSVFTGAITVVIILAAALYFFPCLYLFRFASNMKAALTGNDQARLNGSFKNLKSCFRFVGIMTIIVLSLYALVIVVAIIGVLVGRH